ncbi:MAG: hypothetical protein JNJ88_19050 [Planctomycetes bacterium]|nr:hypothetical protein [Planctomycetota bacterium]
MSDNHEEPKIGAGHAAAMFRQGLSELRGALYAESNVAQPAQYGLYGTRTPGEVMLDKTAEVQPDIDEQPRPREADREPPGMDRE